MQSTLSDNRQIELDTQLGFQFRNPHEASQLFFFISIRIRSHRRPQAGDQKKLKHSKQFLLPETCSLCLSVSSLGWYNIFDLLPTCLCTFYRVTYTLLHHTVVTADISTHARQSPACSLGRLTSHHSPSIRKGSTSEWKATLIIGVSWLRRSLSDR